MTHQATSAPDTDPAGPAAVNGKPLLYRVILGTLGALGLYLIFYSWNLGVGSLQHPASGLWVLIVAALIILALPGALLVRENFESFDRERVVHALVMVGGLVLFVALYPLLGFLLSGAISLFIITRWSAEEGLRNSLLIAALTPTVLYLLFGVAFHVSLDLIPGWL